MKLPLYTETSHCHARRDDVSGLSCRSCRSSLHFRQSLTKAFRLPDDDVNFDCPHGVPWDVAENRNPKPQSHASGQKPLTRDHVAKHALRGARSIAKTSLGIDRLPAEQITARLDVCRACPGEHATFRKGDVHTCGPMLKSLKDKNRKTCGCILRAKAKDRKEDCPFGYWPKPDPDGETPATDMNASTTPAPEPPSDPPPHVTYRPQYQSGRRVMCRADRRDAIERQRQSHVPRPSQGTHPSNTKDTTLPNRRHNGHVQAKTLYDWFGRVVVINLDRRPDRWDQLQRHLSEVNWPFRYPERFRAIDAQKIRPPTWWRAGAPAWGCHQSHLRVLEQALQDGMNSILVLEDDVCFSQDFRRNTEQFLEALPNDWHQIYLGGQYIRPGKNPPTAVNHHVLKAHNINRMHAYAMRGSFIPAAYKHLCDYESHVEQHKRLGPKGGEKAHHVDHRMGVLHESGRWNIYCPTTWLAGQGAGRSDILGKDLGPRYWQRRVSKMPAVSQPPKRRLLFLAHPRSGTRYMAKLCQSYGLDVKHERIGADGICSWMLAADADHSPYGDGTVFSQYEYETVVRVVRHPLKVLASSIHTENHEPEKPLAIGDMSLRDYLQRHAFKERSLAYRRHFLHAAGHLNGSASNRYEQAVEVLLGWDKLIESRRPKFTIHAENATVEVQDSLGLGSPTGSLPSKRVGRRRHPDLTWAELQKHLRPELVQAMHDYAERYGYDLETPGQLLCSSGLTTDKHIQPDGGSASATIRHIEATVNDSGGGVSHAAIV